MPNPIRRFFLLGLFVALALVSKVAGATEYFPHPVFDKDRRFVISSAEAATVLQDSSLPINAVYFNRASVSCGISPDDVLKKLKILLGPSSALWSTLNLVFPDSQRQLADRQVTLFIDDFNNFAGPRPDFSSYYIKIEGQPVVGISCGALFRSYWLPTLVHEFTHALSDGRNLESWFEEGLAQNLENEIGGAQPELTLKALKGFPSLLETRKPLPSKESYAINQLFVRYIRTMAGGWDILKAMTLAEPKCVETDFLSRIACRGKFYLEGPTFRIHNSPEILLGPDKMSRQGLLRHFAVAMTLNGLGTEKYFIYNWAGLEIPLKPQLQVLQPGQFQAWTDEKPYLNLNQNLEFYRVLVNERDEFVILSRAEVYDTRSIENARLKLGKFSKSFYLLINTNLNAYKIRN
jgi:hypothetical protein